MTKQLGSTRATFPGVELVAVGDWSGVKGKGKVDAEDIVDMIAAANDPMIDASPLKFGHFSSLGDGEPAPGWVENIRANEDGTKAVGDFVNVPPKLVPLIRDGFRRRSVELKHNVAGTGGRIYKSSLKALALLGVAPPAVKGLNELAETYASELDGEDVDAIYLGEADLECDTPKVPHPGSAGGNDSNEAVDKSTTAKDAGKDETVAFKDAVIKKFGLAETATDEEIEAAIEAAELAAPADNKDKDKDTGAGAGTGDDKDKGGAPAGTEGGDAPETIVVSKAVYEADQATLRRLEERANEADRTDAVDTALSEGKIAPSEVAQYTALLKSSPEAGMTLLSELPVKFSTRAVGHHGVGASSASEVSDDERKNMHAAAKEQGW